MSYIEPPPPPPPSAPQPAAQSRTRSRGRALAWVAGAVVLLLAAAGAAVAFVPSVSQLVGLSAAASPTAGPSSTQTSKPTTAQTTAPAPSPTATASPTATFRIAREITASPTRSPEPTQQPSSSASDEPSTSSDSSTDLGLEQRVDILPCTGEYVSFHFSAIDPSSYASDISDSLDNYPGSRYLLTEGSCDALNQASKQNTRIYAVYSGPFATAEEACQNQREYPGGYVTHLRPANDLDPTVDCS